MEVTDTNLLLSALHPKDRDRLLANATSVNLPMKVVLYRSEKQPRYGFFITSGFASIVTRLEQGHSAEVGMIGPEGLVGALHLLGPGLSPSECFMQSDGTALKISFEHLCEAYLQSTGIRQRILEFVQTQALSASQISACHRLHGAEARLARWLLMVRDRIKSDVLDLTQEFLAEMLGSRRSTVTLVAGALQRKGLIEYSRGRVRILDGKDLEAAACSCYPIIRALTVNPYARSLQNGEAVNIFSSVSKGNGKSLPLTEMA
jgi:CRP-like cAMP-binding protein